MVAMTWALDLDSVPGVLIVRTRGVLARDTAEAMRREAFGLLVREACRRVLLDHRALEGVALDTLEIYGLPETYESLGVPHDLRMAVLAAPAVRGDLGFFETVCRNRGYAVSLFAGESEALAWLGA